VECSLLKRVNNFGNYKVHVHESVKRLLHNAHLEPTVNLDLITPEGYIQYLLILHHQGQEGYLSLNICMGTSQHL